MYGKKCAADEQLVSSTCKSPHMCTSAQQTYDSPGSATQVSSPDMPEHSPPLVKDTLNVNVCLYPLPVCYLGSKSCE